MTVTARGASELADGLRAAADGLRGGLTDTNAAVAHAIAAAVQPPVLSGALARTVQPTWDATTASVTAGGGGVRYAGVQERRFRYLARALDQTTPQVLDLIARGVGRELQAVSHG
jgi:hypothetical protein